ncbi:MAG: dethiobiotin synthase [Gammaproteobacteria bacterium]|nr:dethiobiotin synthase [Gammaproteobacteria bacterium]
MTARGLFVTGTDTGVGKTRVAAALMLRLRAAGLEVAGMKPVAAGCEDLGHGLRNDDALRLMACASRERPYEEINPYALAPPIAPHIAAAEAGVALDLARLAAAYRVLAEGADVVVVEGAGGWLVPLDDRHTLADLAGVLDLDAVLVVGMRLGCLNHALLTAESIAARGLRLAGWVANCIEPGTERLDAQIDTLRGRLHAPCLGILPHLPSATPEESAEALRPPPEVRPT